MSTEREATKEESERKVNFKKVEKNKKKWVKN